MMKLEEMMKIYPELVIDNREGLEILLEEKYKMQVEEAKSEGVEIGKSEGIVEGVTQGRIESAYSIMTKGGISFDGVSAILNLSEIEQAMLRHRMAQNGH
jgi:flagellar biosynthesis/type III secretory pathway protein FliH